MLDLGHLRRRRWASIGGTALVVALLLLLGGHRGQHVVRNLLVPGGGLLDERPIIGIAIVAMAVLATVSWLRWGADWLLATVVVASMLMTAVLAGGHDDPVARWSAQRSAHEFPLVVLVVGAIAWARAVAGRVPGLQRLVGRRHRRRHGTVDLASLSPVDRCRVVALTTLVDPPSPDAASQDAAAEIDDGVRRRARRVGALARGRFTGDPFRRDHAHARAARAMAAGSDADDLDRLAADAARSPLGVPCSEPGWVRPLDATLTALALARSGRGAALDAWRHALLGPFALRGSHRAGAWWTPLGLRLTSMPAWEHATVTGLARAAGVLDDDEDWTALRRRALGAAARGGSQPEDERMIGAARIWLALVDDPEADRIVHRAGVRHDPLACALDRLAARLRSDTHLLFITPTPRTVTT
jgi:hypothetical protein